MWQLFDGRKRKSDTENIGFALFTESFKKKYLTCKMPPLHRCFSVHRVYLFFHLVCIMYFLCIAHSNDSSFLYTSLCVHIYMYFIYIYMYICDLHFSQLVVWAGLCPASYCGSNPCGMI